MKNLEDQHKDPQNQPLMCRKQVQIALKSTDTMHRYDTSTLFKSIHFFYLFHEFCVNMSTWLSFSCTHEIECDELCWNKNFFKLEIRWKVPHINCPFLSYHIGGSSNISKEHHFTGRRIATGRQRLLKRGSPMATGTQPSLESSHKRKSFRNRKQSKQAHLEEEEKSDGGETFSTKKIAKLFPFHF